MPLLIYSTPEYKTLISKSGDYYSVLEAFLKDAEIFKRIRATIRQEADAPLSESDELQLLDQKLRSMTEKEQHKMIDSINARKAEYDAQFTLAKNVHIANGRHMASDSMSSRLHSAGFALIPHCSSVPVEELSRMGKLQAQEYYTELLELAKTQLLPDLGQSAPVEVRAFCNTHLVRSELAAGSTGSGDADEPLTFVHNDFTSFYKEVVLSSYEGSDYGTNEVDGFHPAGDCREEMRRAGLTVEQLRESRIVVLNTWRSIGTKGPLRRKPLAVCDLRTLDPSRDLFSESVGPGTVSLFALPLFAKEMT
jgi:hypothetical protein